MFIELLKSHQSRVIILRIHEKLKKSGRPVLNGCYGVQNTSTRHTTVTSRLKMRRILKERDAFMLAVRRLFVKDVMWKPANVVDVRTH